MSDSAGTPVPPGHPDPDVIADLADPAAPDADRPDTEHQVRQHVAVCPDCQATLAGLRAVRAALAGLPATTLPSPVRLRVEAALAAESTARSAVDAPRRPRPAAWLAAAAAAAVVVLGGGAAVRGLLENRETGVSSTARSEATRGDATPGAVDASPPPVPTTGMAAATAADRAAVTARVRALVGSHRFSEPGGSAAPEQMAGGASQSAVGLRSGSDPAVTGCLDVLGLPGDRLFLAAGQPFGGEPALVLVLLPAGTAPAAGADLRAVDVRVVRPGCPRGGADLRYRVDGLRVP